MIIGFLPYPFCLENDIISLYPEYDHHWDIFHRHYSHPIALSGFLFRSPLRVMSISRRPVFIPLPDIFFTPAYARSWPSFPVLNLPLDRHPLLNALNSDKHHPIYSYARHPVLHLADCLLEFVLSSRPWSSHRPPASSVGTVLSFPCDSASRSWLSSTSPPPTSPSAPDSSSPWLASPNSFLLLSSGRPLPARPTPLCLAPSIVSSIRTQRHAALGADPGYWSRLEAPSRPRYGVQAGRWPLSPHADVPRPSVSPLPSKTSPVSSDR